MTEFLSFNSELIFSRQKIGKIYHVECFILYLDNHLQQYGLQYLILKCIKWASQKKINSIIEAQHFSEKKS